MESHNLLDGNRSKNIFQRNERHTVRSSAPTNPNRLSFLVNAPFLVTFRASSHHGDFLFIPRTYSPPESANFESPQAKKISDETRTCAYYVIKHLTGFNRFVLRLTKILRSFHEAI